MKYLTFITVCKGFLPITFMGERCELKKTKTCFINVSKNPILNLSPVWEAPFCQKCQNLCTLLCMVPRYTRI
jgi:hypothetical protein